MSILIDPMTGEEYENVPPKIAAEYLDIGIPSMYSGLKSGIFPFGSAIPPQSEGGKWKFLIPVERLKAYKNASDLKFDYLIDMVESLKAGA